MIPKFAKSAIIGALTIGSTIVLAACYGPTQRPPRPPQNETDQPATVQPPNANPPAETPPVQPEKNPTKTPPTKK